MKKLDKSKPYEEVVGSGAPYRYFQDGFYYKACGSPCDVEGKLLRKKTTEESLIEVADLNRNDQLEKPLVMPERLDAKPKSLRKASGDK
jgi:hypothetical protein